MKDIDYAKIARNVLTNEAEAIMDAAKRVNGDITRSVEAICKSKGRIIVCGMGKSGHVGSKMAATFASTGTPSFFVHPAEAFHGDLGMITPDDVFIAISNSGESEEVVRLLSYLKDNGNTIIAMTGNANSTLGKAADVVVSVAVKEEACPLRLAPTTSTTVTLALGDALAIAVMTAKDFKPENFARFHPGGALGRKLLCKVRDEMHATPPVVSPNTSVMDVISTITKSKLGLTIVKDDNLLGIITDGDLRRALNKHESKALSLQAHEIMKTNPVSIDINKRISEAQDLMTERCISSLVVKDNGCFVGIIKK